MADFLQERAAAGKPKKPNLPNLPKAKQRIAGLEAPRPTKHKRSKRERELEALLRDFRLGLTSLRGLTQRLKTTKPDYVAQTGKKAPAPPAITKIVERERKVIERLISTLPSSERTVILREYERAAKGVVQERAPQAYAAILRASELVSPPKASPSAPLTVQPAAVLRPNQPYVKELMVMAKAIRAGRLPFIPKVIVQRARELLSVLFGKKRATELVTSRDVVTRRLISQYRLIPRSVQAAVSVTPKRQQSRAQQELQQLISRAVTSRPSPAGTSHRSPVELAELEKRGLISPQDVAALPAMHTGGVAGPGEVRTETKEGVQVITQADSMVNVPPAGDSPVMPRAEIGPTKSGGGRNVASPPRTAPPPAKSTASVMGVVDPTPKPIAVPGAESPFSEGLDMSRKKKLTVNDIEGLDRWMTTAEERLRNNG